MGKEYKYATKYNLISYLVNFGLSATSSLVSNSLFYKFCRDQEREADITSVSVNNDVNALISGIEKIEKMYKKTKNLRNIIWNKIETVFRPHPLTIDREDYLSKVDKG